MAGLTSLFSVVKTAVLWTCSKTARRSQFYGQFSVGWVIFPTFVTKLLTLAVLWTLFGLAKKCPYNCWPLQFYGHNDIRIEYCRKTADLGSFMDNSWLILTWRIKCFPNGLVVPTAVGNMSLFFSLLCFVFSGWYLIEIKLIGQVGQELHSDWLRHWLGSNSALSDSSVNSYWERTIGI